MPRQKRSRIDLPFVVAVSSAEQLPYSFSGIHGDSDERYLPISVRTESKRLATGDYSIVGMENLVTIERKSLSDFYGSFVGDNRRREEEKCQRMMEMTFRSGDINHRGFQNFHAYAAYVVEAEWSTILHRPPRDSELNPKTLIRTVMSWNLKYPRVHWWFLDGRRMAELVTFQLLRKFHRHYKDSCDA